jgi:hypothetical protein
METGQSLRRSLAVIVDLLGTQLLLVLVAHTHPRTMRGNVMLRCPVALRLLLCLCTLGAAQYNAWQPMEINFAFPEPRASFGSTVRRHKCFLNDYTRSIHGGCTRLLLSGARSPTAL